MKNTLGRVPLRPTRPYCPTYAPGRKGPGHPLVVLGGVAAAFVSSTIIRRLWATATVPHAKMLSSKLKHIHRMILRFQEQIVNEFLIPAFTLSEGEIVIIQLPDGPYLYEVEMELVKLLTGKHANTKVRAINTFQFVEHIKTNSLRYRLFPLTVISYLKKYANSSNPIYKKIFDISWITPKRKINELSGTLRKLLSLYATLSWTNKIILDLIGVDPQGGQDIYAILQNVLKNGGAVILIDRCDEFKGNCTTFIQAKYQGVNNVNHSNLK